MPVFAADVLPDATGRNLGSPLQLWNLFSQTLLVTGGVFQLNSVDQSSSLVISVPNGGDPSLASSTGRIAVQTANQLILQGTTPLVSYSPDGTRSLQIGTPNAQDPIIDSSTGQVTVSGVVNSVNGYRCRAGDISGSATSNVFNFYYDSSGQMEVWVDNGDIGYMALKDSGNNMSLLNTVGCNALNCSGTVTANAVTCTAAVTCNTLTVGSASLSSSSGWFVNGSGPIRGNGFGCQAGVAGAQSGTAFTINVDKSLWLGTVNQGVISVTSDYRLKRNIEPLGDGALGLVDQLRVVKFDFVNLPGELPYADGVRHVGFVAHEVGEVFPSGCYGEKDALTSDGKIQPQGIRQLDVVALLTKAVQELSEKIKALEAATKPEPSKT